MFKVAFKDGRDYTGVYLSVAFKKGEGETDSEYLAEKFKAKGMIVEQVGKPESPAGQDNNPYAKMKGKELDTKAAELGVDLSDCKINAEKAAKLFEAEQTLQSGQGDNEFPEE